jgi:hypothetical protein
VQLDSHLPVSAVVRRPLDGGDVFPLRRATYPELYLGAILRDPESGSAPNISGTIRLTLSEKKNSVNSGG